MNIHRFLKLIICVLINLKPAICFAVSKATPNSKPLLRISGSINNARINSKGDLLAFTDEQGRDLRILDLNSKSVYLVSQAKVDLSFFWAPNGFRLFYKETTASNGQISNTVKAYDTKRKASVVLDVTSGKTGILTFDPRDFRFLMMHEKGILSKRLIYPDERLSRWQIAQRTDNGKWLIGSKQITWLSNRGLSISTVEGDQSGIQSFDISPDGSHVVWASKKGVIFISKQGEKASSIAEGSDVRWHPSKPFFVFSKDQKIGNKIVGKDLALGKIDGSVKVLTSTPIALESSAVWLPDGNRILYSNLKSTDLFLMDIK